MTNILLKEFSTPLGTMIAGATNEGLCLLDFKSSRSDVILKELEILLNTSSVPGANEFTMQAEKELAEYFESNRKEFNVRLLVPGTEFQHKVWDSIKMIQFGQTVTYERHAALLEMPLAIRAVAHAIGSNRILIMIPCHRIKGKNGDLRGYAGGLDRKRQLLDLESGSSLFGLEY